MVVSWSPSRTGSENWARSNFYTQRKINIKDANRITLKYSGANLNDGNMLSARLAIFNDDNQYIKLIDLYNNNTVTEVVLDVTDIIENVHIGLYLSQWAYPTMVKQVVNIFELSIS